MDKIFLLQVVVSFLFGGAFVAFLTFWAEKSTARVAGIIISVPSTIAIGYLFMGLTVSAEAVAKVAPMVPMGSGILMIFTMVYLYMSKIPLKKSYSVALCTVSSLFVWFLLALPMAIYKFDKIWISILVYIVCLALGFQFLTIRVKLKAYHKPLVYTIWEKVFRSVFAGGIIALIVVLSKTFGPFWGGVFTVFPAVFLSSMIVFHIRYDSDFLFRIWKNSPIGSLVFVSFAIASIYTFPAFGVIGGLIGSYFVSFLAYELIRRLRVD